MSFYRITIENNSDKSFVRIETYWEKIPKFLDIQHDIMKQIDKVPEVNALMKMELKYTLQFFKNSGFIPQKFESECRPSQLFGNKIWIHKAFNGKIIMAEHNFGNIEVVHPTEPS